MLAPYIISGDMRALATASSKRLSYLPDVPTAPEVGVPGWEVDTWSVRTTRHAA
jgi:tripartite-type tricarboxylate transporter receptor subunit TctC